MTNDTVHTASATNVAFVQSSVKDIPISTVADLTFENQIAQQTFDTPRIVITNATVHTA